MTAPRRCSGRSIATTPRLAIDCADGLVRVGVQSAVEYPETSALIRRLMEERGIPTPPKDRTNLSVCVVLLCAGSN